MAKQKCDCGKEAKYLYMPGYANGGNSFVCDDCISSVDYEGCSCNYHRSKDEYAEQPEGVEGKEWRWVDKENDIWIHLDERGRPYPCVEYDYSEDGYDVPTWWSNLCWDISFKWFLFKDKCKSWWKRHICAPIPPDQDF